MLRINKIGNARAKNAGNQKSRGEMYFATTDKSNETIST